MKIIDIQVDWNDWATNFPAIRVLVTEDTPPEKEVYEKRSGVYRSQQGVIIHHFYYTRPGEGFAGRSFKIDVRNESTGEITQETLIGPWHGGASGVNAAFPDRDKAVEGIYTYSPSDFERGYTLYAGMLSVASIINYAREIDFVFPVIHFDRNGTNRRIVKEKLKLAWVKAYRSEIFCPIKNDGTPKENFTKTEVLTTYDVLG